MAIKIVGKIELPQKKVKKALSLRQLIALEQEKEREIEIEYDKYIERYQMLHWYTLGINKEITERYFENN
jgi:hypothetical protein